MIRVRRVSKIYLNTQKTDTDDAVALDDVSLDLPSSGFVSIIGKSGSGKTSLLYLIGGLDSPTDGELTFENQNYSDFNLDSFRSTKVGFVFPDYDLFTYETVEENFKTALDIRHKKYDRKESISVLNEVDLSEEYLERKVSELSAEEKLRVSIARALIKDSEIILADEPTGALDDETGDLIFRLLKKISSDRLVVVASRNRESLDRYSDRIIQLNNGKVTDDSVMNIPIKTESSETGDLSKKHKVFSFLRKIRFSFSRFGYKWPLLFLAVVFGVISLTCSSIFILYENFDTVNTQLSTLQDHDVQFAFLHRNSTYRSPFSSDNLEYTSYTERQLDTIDEYNGFSTVYFGTTRDATVYYKYLNTDFISNPISDTERRERQMRRLFTNCMKLDDSITESDLAISKDSRFIDESKCSLPKASDEIAITSLNYEAFEKYGYVDDDGNVYSINTPDDMIGRNIGDFVIVGVYSTSEDTVLESELDSDSTYYSSFISSTHMYNAVFASADTLFDTYQDSVFIRLDSDISITKQMLRKLTYSEPYTITRYGETYQTTLKASVEMYSSYDHFYDRVVTIFGDVADEILILSAVVFAVLTVLILIIHQKDDFLSRTRNYGILVSLGASRAETYEISFLKLFFITIIELISSILVLLIVYAVLNHIYNVCLFAFTVFDFLTVLGFSLLFSLIVGLFTFLTTRKCRAADIFRQ